MLLTTYSCHVRCWLHSLNQQGLPRRLGRHLQRELSCHRTACGRLSARKISQDANTDEDWSALARDDPTDESADEQLLSTINKACNKALRLMLKADSRGLEYLKDDLNVLGESCAKQNKMNAALFVYVLYQMTENVLAKEAVNLQGPYLSAFEKMFSVLEDSGWQLGEEGKPPVEMVDDELMQAPGTLGSYSS